MRITLSIQLQAPLELREKIVLKEFGFGQFDLSEADNVFDGLCMRRWGYYSHRFSAQLQELGLTVSWSTVCPVASYDLNIVFRFSRTLTIPNGIESSRLLRLKMKNLSRKTI